MSLVNVIEDLKSQLEEEKKKEEETIQQEEVKEDPAEQPEQKEPEAPKEEEKKVEASEEKLDNSAYARMRREKAAAEKRALELESRLNKLEESFNRAPQPVEAPTPVQEDIRADTRLSAEIVESHQLQQAEKEFKVLEERFRQDNQNYDAVASEYASALAQSIKLQNPRLTPTEIAERTKRTILVKAADYLTRGFDPIQELYHDAVDLGFTGKKRAAEVSVEEPKELRPDMKKVAANRERSSGMVAASGHSEGALTPFSAAGMTNAEWKRLPKSEKMKIFEQLRK